eukprot:141674_1
MGCGCSGETKSNESCLKEQAIKDILNKDNQDIEKHIDFSSFNYQSSKCNGYKKCDYLRSAYIGLKYYNSLRKELNKKRLLVEFCKETYKTILDDYNHIIKQHGNDIKLMANELINNYGFKQCNIGKCNTLKRHYFRNQNDNNINNNEYDDAEYMFF